MNMFGRIGRITQLASLAAAAALCFAGTGAYATPLRPCPGDCDLSGQVSVGELITGVNIALGTAALSTCRAFDSDGNRQVTIDELVKGVTAALGGCPESTPLQRALIALTVGDLNRASNAFCALAASDSSDSQASLYCGVTQAIAQILDDASLRAVAQGAGITISGSSGDVCGFQVNVPHELPADAPRTGAILSATRAVVLPVADALVSRLAGLPDALEATFDVGNLPLCTSRRSQSHTIEIDHSDVLALRAGLQAVRAAFDVLAAYNIDVDLADVIHHTPQSVLGGAQTLLTLNSAASLATAAQSFDDALTTSANAITAVLAETDDQSNDLLIIAPNDRDTAQALVGTLNSVRESLHGRVVLGTDRGQPARLDLSLFFSGRLTSLRPLLPTFDRDGNFDLQHFPDSTFGGTAPDLTQGDIDRAIPKIRRFLLQFGPHDCYLYDYATDQAACDALAAQNDCTGAYFYPPQYCSLYSCACGL